MQLADIARAMPRTDLLYYSDSYLQTFEAQILNAVREQGRSWYLVLDRTAFHPKGGGQPSDVGVAGVGGVEAVVKKAIMVGGVVVHYVKFGVDFEPRAGDRVHGSVSWSERYLYMRRHTAAHLMDHCLNVSSGRVNKTTSSWLGEPEAYVAYQGDLPSSSVIDSAQELARQFIKSSLNVSINFLSRGEVAALRDAPNSERLPESEVYRVVRIHDFERIPCGGTHVKNTVEIGGFTVKRAVQEPGEFKIFYDVV